MRIASLTSFGLVFLLAQPVAAQTSSFALGTPGILYGVVASPTAVSVFEPTTIAVGVSGQCGEVIITFGDGTATTLTGVTNAANATHSYTKAGTFVIRASPGSSCNAATPITATVNVEGSAVDLLCALAGCDDARPEPCLKPTIKSVTYTAPLEPNEALIVHGCGFGDPATRGGTRKLTLRGAFPTAGIAVPLQIQVWSETAVMAKVPSIKGVKDQNAWLQIESEPYTSNQVPVSFRATRVIRRLWQYENVVAITGSPNAWGNQCINARDRGCVHVSPGKSASGVDLVSVTLGNGWVIERPAFYSGYASPFALQDFLFLAMQGLEKKAPVFDASGFVAGKPTGVLRVSWTNGPASWSGFYGDVYVKGPRCVKVADWVTWPGTDPLNNGWVCFSAGDTYF